MPGLAKVENLTIRDCKELSLWQDRLNSLVTLDIRSSPSLVNINYLMSTLRILRIGDCNALKSLLMSNCTCLEYASIEKCDSLTFISRGKLLPTLKRLEIKYCEKLLFVVDEEGEASSSHPSLLMNKENLCSNSYSYGSLLEHLEISDCPSLKCLWDLTYHA